MSDALISSLQAFGAPSASVLDLRTAPSPGHLRYLDLMGGAPFPAAVVEFQREPLAYTIDALRAPPEARALSKIRQTLTLRSDAPYLAVVEPGRLTIHALTLGDAQDAAVCVLEQSEHSSSQTFQRLSLEPETFGLRPQVHEVHDRLLELLNATIESLMNSGLSHPDSISLAGRALFLRFLLDRGVLSPTDVHGVGDSGAAESLFATIKSLDHTCQWLDETFNGDFLPFAWDPQSAHAEQQHAVLQSLSDIMHRSRSRQLSLFRWADVDFAHVPSGLLSQVYEHQIERAMPRSRRRESVYYTPRRIAEHITREVFSGLSRERGVKDAMNARVLDPASGGGIFLVSAFRELVRLRWEGEDRRPDSAALRRILYNQIAGMEISEPAIRFSALSLYLTALELDPDPQPLSALKFEPLLGQTLFFVAGAPSGTSDLGSLAQVGTKQFGGDFDVIVGNPPWTSVREQGAALTEAVRPVVAERLGAERAAEFSIPDANPDLAFAWKAAQWSAPNGWIALAMHARLLFKDTLRGRQARSDFFEAFAVTGIVNCSDLRATNVWPNVTAPFCLLFYRNRRPTETDALYFLSPYRETGLNAQGRLRLDATSAYPVQVLEVPRRPWLLKALARGSHLDVAILDKLLSSGLVPLREYWAESLGLPASQGYQDVASRRSRSSDASSLRGLPNLRRVIPDGITINTTSLPPFDHERLWRTRSRDVYRSPLLIIRKSPPAQVRSGRLRAHCAFEDVVFHEYMFGYSAHGHPMGEALVQYLSLFLNTDIPVWQALMTAHQFGIEREVFQKHDVDSLLVAPIESLPSSTVDRIASLYSEAAENWEGVAEEVNGLMADICGLSNLDREVIADTLAFGLPYSANRRNAERSPSRSMMSAFAGRIAALIRRVLGDEVLVELLPLESGSPWGVIAVYQQSERIRFEPHTAEVLSVAGRAADEHAASQFVVVDHSVNAAFVAVLMESRYWTQSRARLLGADLVENRPWRSGEELS